MKAALTVLNDGRTVTDEVLLITIAEAEELINSRPNTYVGLEPGPEEALTPIHFVRGVGAIEVEQTVQRTSEGEALRDRTKRSQHVADQLWTRWVAEYMPTIYQRTKWHSESPSLTCGDRVYFADEENLVPWHRDRGVPPKSGWSNLASHDQDGEG